MSYVDSDEPYGPDVVYERARNRGVVWCHPHNAARWGPGSCSDQHERVDTRPPEVPKDRMPGWVWWLVLTLALGGWSFGAFFGVTPGPGPWQGWAVAAVVCAVVALGLMATEPLRRGRSEVRR